MPTRFFVSDRFQSSLFDFYVLFSSENSLENDCSEVIERVTVCWSNNSNNKNIHAHTHKIIEGGKKIEKA